MVRAYNDNRREMEEKIADSNIHIHSRRRTWRRIASSEQGGEAGKEGAACYLLFARRTLTFSFKLFNALRNSTQYFKHQTCRKSKEIHVEHDESAIPIPIPKFYCHSKKYVDLIGSKVKGTKYSVFPKSTTDM